MKPMMIKHKNDQKNDIKMKYMKKFKTTLFNVLVLILTLSSSAIGQSYFNTLLMNQLSSGYSHDLALAGANTSEFSGPGNTFNNPANQSEFKGLQIVNSVMSMGMNENRSYPAIDQFGDVVTDNVYVVSRGSQQAYSMGVSWGTGKLGASFASAPFVTPAFFYKEEIRGSLYPPNVNRDPLIGYHHMEQSGIIQGTGVSTATAFGSWSVGVGLRMLHGIGLENQFGVTVLNSVDTSAMAAGTTFLQTEDWSLDNTPVVVNLGIIKDLGMHWRVSASYQTGYTLESTRQGAIPVFDAALAYPVIAWSADTLGLVSKMPAKLEAGLRMKPSNPLPTSVFISIAYQDWSGYSTSYSDSLADGSTSFEYPMQETFTINGGVEHWISEQVPFRAGFSWIESPLAHQLAQSRFSAGSGWVNGPLQFDVAMQLSSIQYSFKDLFTPVGLTANDREHIRETNTTYSFTVSYSL